MKLETDLHNIAEIAEASRTTAPKLALWFYRDRIAEGYNRDCARCQAISYLRRKTGLTWPLAASAFDQHLQDRAEAEERADVGRVLDIMYGRETPPTNPGA